MRASRLCMLNLCSQRYMDYGSSCTIVWKAVLYLRTAIVLLLEHWNFVLNKVNVREEVSTIGAERGISGC